MTAKLLIIKNILFGALFFSSCVIQAYCIEDLEQAIQTSDLQRVQAILPTIQLSEQDKTRLTYLAQDVLCFCNNECTAQDVSPRIGGKGKIATLAGMITLFGGVSYLMVQMILRPHSSDDIQVVVPLWIVGAALVQGGALYGSYELSNKLKERYQNALKIKQLIMKKQAQYSR